MHYPGIGTFRTRSSGLSCSTSYDRLVNNSKRSFGEMLCRAPLAIYFAQRGRHPAAILHALTDLSMTGDGAVSGMPCWADEKIAAFPPDKILSSGNVPQLFKNLLKISPVVRDSQWSFFIWHGEPGLAKSPK